VAYIQWNQDLILGNQVIDYQHKRLVGLINDLYEIQEKEDFKEELVEVIVEELKQYAKFHFDTEEKYYKKLNHEGLTEHRKIHRSFEETINSFLSDRDKFEDVGQELFSFLKDWLEKHIKIEDKGMIERATSSGGLV
jgi:hemerythrin